MHVLAAQEIFVPYLSRPPTSCLGALVLEAYIYHVALNSTFHAETLRSYDHLDNLVKTLMASPSFHDASTTSHRRSLWLEIPPELLACIYKISYLRRQTSLSADAWHEVANISRMLDHLTSDDSISTPFHGAHHNGMIWNSRQLHLAATRLVLWKLMSPELRAVDTAVQSLLTAALSNSALLIAGSSLSWYPLAVLGTAATAEHDREVITSQLLSIRDLAGHRAIANVLKFHAATWNPEQQTLTHQSMSTRSGGDQLDVWLDEARLRIVGI